MTAMIRAPSALLRRDLVMHLHQTSRLGVIRSLLVGQVDCHDEDVGRPRINSSIAAVENLARWRRSFRVTLAEVDFELAGDFGGEVPSSCGRQDNHPFRVVVLDLGGPTCRPLRSCSTGGFLSPIFAPYSAA